MIAITSDFTAIQSALTVAFNILSVAGIATLATLALVQYVTGDRTVATVPATSAQDEGTEEPATVPDPWMTPEADPVPSGADIMEQCDRATATVIPMFKAPLMLCAAEDVPVKATPKKRMTRKERRSRNGYKSVGTIGSVALRQQYKTLKAFNAAHSTAFKRWKQAIAHVNTVGVASKAS